MTMNRRKFLMVGAGLLAGCAVRGTGAVNGISTATRERTIDAGRKGIWRFPSQRLFSGPPGRATARPLQHLHTPRLRPQRRPGPYFHLPLPWIDLRCRWHRDQGAGAAQPAPTAYPDRRRPGPRSSPARLTTSAPLRKIPSADHRGDLLRLGAAITGSSARTTGRPERAGEIS
jgi:hypothetical protein